MPKTLLCGKNPPALHGLPHIIPWCVGWEAVAISRAFMEQMSQRIMEKSSLNPVFSGPCVKKSAPFPEPLAPVSALLPLAPQCTVPYPDFHMYPHIWPILSPEDYLSLKVIKYMRFTFSLTLSV